MCQNTKCKDEAYIRMADSQKHWQRRTLILMAMLTGKPLAEATLGEWQADYEWVRLNLIQRGMADLPTLEAVS